MSVRFFLKVVAILKRMRYDRLEGRCGRVRCIRRSLSGKCWSMCELLRRIMERVLGSKGCSLSQSRSVETDHERQCLLILPPGWQEIDAAFYFTPSRVAGFFHCTAPSISIVAYVSSLLTPVTTDSSLLRSALLNAGFQVSRSHASAGSMKTNAPRSVVHDIMRMWIRDHPVEMKNIKPTSPAMRLLAKETPFVTSRSFSSSDC